MSIEQEKINAWKRTQKNDSKDILHCACYVGDLSLVIELVEKYGMDVNLPLSEAHGIRAGKTPIYIAAETGQATIISYLLTKNAKITAYVPILTNRMGESETIAAIHYGHAKALFILLQAGASLSTPAGRDIENYAQEKNQLECLKVIRFFKLMRQLENASEADILTSFNRLNEMENSEEFTDKFLEELFNRANLLSIENDKIPATTLAHAHLCQKIMLAIVDAGHPIAIYYRQLAVQYGMMGCEKNETNAQALQNVLEYKINENTFAINPDHLTNEVYVEGLLLFCTFLEKGTLTGKQDKALATNLKKALLDYPQVADTYKGKIAYNLADEYQQQNDPVEARKYLAWSEHYHYPPASLLISHSFISTSKRKPQPVNFKTMPPEPAPYISNNQL